MSKWFKQFTKECHPKLRIFCFPYAGGGAHVFSSWADRLPEDIGLFAVEAPGRGSRFLEPPIACLRTQVELLYQEILPLANIPYLFIGHSNGALVAYELARKLQANGVGNLKHIVISAKAAPQLPWRKGPVHDLPKEQFLSELKDNDFTPKEVIENDELMELLLPMLRADFGLTYTHQFEPEPKLEVDASLFWGKNDVDVSHDDMVSWKELIKGKTQLVEFTDGHFFISTQEDEFLFQVNSLLTDILV